MNRSAGRELTDNLMRVKYSGYGGSFWYAFHETKETDNICANHLVSSPFDGLPQPKQGGTPI